MANQRKITNGRRRQIVMSAPTKLFVERYLTNKGKYMLVNAKTRAEKDAVWARYGKNKYRNNPEAVPVKCIFHRQLHTSEVL
jgi:hypothetical protein